MKFVLLFAHNLRDEKEVDIRSLNDLKELQTKLMAEYPPSKDFSGELIIDLAKRLPTIIYYDDYIE